MSLFDSHAWGKEGLIGGGGFSQFQGPQSHVRRPPRISTSIIASVTDIGGGTGQAKENQDTHFTWNSPPALDGESFLRVLCVLDGHGRELGRHASEAARDYLRVFFESNWRRFENEAEITPLLTFAHTEAHKYIRQAFRAELGKMGDALSLQESTDGYLVYHHNTASIPVVEVGGEEQQPTPPPPPLQQKWSLVQGGTTCSIALIIANRFIYTANVGDSTGLLCTSLPVLYESDLQPLTTGSGAGKALGGSGGIGGGGGREVDEDDNIPAPSTLLVVTAEHSPECPHEFARMRTFRTREGDPSQPALSVLFDSIHKGGALSPCFSVDGGTGRFMLNKKGHYYKNVRKEWASLVSAPPTCAFPDSLAFTRSLGDFHLQTYGVSHTPDVQRVDLFEVFAALKHQAQAFKFSSVAGTGGGSASEALSYTALHPLASSVACLVLASDGVWDNWKYEDVQKFVMDDSCLDLVQADALGVQKITNGFMERNASLARSNFGSQADNATGLIVYFYADDDTEVSVRAGGGILSFGEATSEHPEQGQEQGRVESPLVVDTRA